MSTTLMPLPAQTLLTKPLHDCLGETLHAHRDLGVFVTTEKSWQIGHDHGFDRPTRMGDTSCIGCGAAAWSPDWVKPGVMGEGTHEWVIMLVESYSDLVAQSLLERELGAEVIDVLPPMSMPEPEPCCEVVIGTANGVERYPITHQPAQVILAVNEPDEPARRSGIPVPAMTRGVLGPLTR